MSFTVITAFPHLKFRRYFDVGFVTNMLKKRSKCLVRMYLQEADKIALSESTGLDQKQINNWFINQRKRHWKSSENMQLAVMDNLSGHFLPEN